MFISLALLLQIAGAPRVGVIGAWVFFGFRIAYVPAYLGGPAGLRSTCWTLSWTGLGAMIYALLS